MTDHHHLDRTWSEIASAAERLRLQVFPAAPVAFEGGVVVYWPDNDWSAFVDVAATVSAPLLYLAGRTFGPHPDRSVRDVSDSMPAFDEAGLDGGVEKMARPSVPTHLDGVLGGIDLGFSIGGVLHRCSLTEPWFGHLEDQIADFIDDQLDAGNSERSYLFRDPQLEEATANELERLQPIVAEAAARIAALPAYLASTNSQQRRTIVDGDAAVLSWKDADYATASGRAALQARSAVTERAEELAAEARSERVAKAMGEFQTFVEQLLADDDYQAAGLAKARQRATKAFVIQHLGFAANDFADRLYSAAQKVRGPR